MIISIDDYYRKRDQDKLYLSPEAEAYVLGFLDAVDFMRSGAKTDRKGTQKRSQRRKGREDDRRP